MGADSKKKNKTIRKLREANYFDYSLLVVILFLLCFGMVILYSTSSYNAQIKYGDPAYFLKRQLTAVVLGLIPMIFMIFWGDRILKNKVMVGFIFMAALFTVVLVKTPLGINSHGATRWVKIGPLSFQPAEFVKLATIILVAYLCSRYARQLKNIGNEIRILLAVVAAAGLIILLTKNLSSALIIMCIGVAVLFIASPNWKEFAALLGVGFLGVIAIIFFGSGFRADRVTAWRNPTLHMDGIGYQIVQGLYAIGSGGLFGKGLGNSVQKLGFIPEAQNDYIFTIICEELGLFGAAAVIMLFIFMIWRFMVIANSAPTLYDSLLVVGVMAHIAIQVILNIAVVTNSIPNTGVTLPFISYGGTSVVFLMTEMGMVLGVSRKIKME